VLSLSYIDVELSNIASSGRVLTMVRAALLRHGGRVVGVVWCCLPLRKPTWVTLLPLRIFAPPLTASAFLPTVARHFTSERLAPTSQCLRELDSASSRRQLAAHIPCRPCYPDRLNISYVPVLPGKEQRSMHMTSVIRQWQCRWFWLPFHWSRGYGKIFFKLRSVNLQSIRMEILTRARHDPHKRARLAGQGFVKPK
jgi:hypothetical protein